MHWYRRGGCCRWIDALDGLGLARPGGQPVDRCGDRGGTWSLFRQSLHLLFDGVPDEIDPQAMHDYLARLPGVQQAHDLHIWAMDTAQAAMTAHLVMPDGQADDAFLHDVSETLHERFEITHSTIQVNRRPITTASSACGPWECVQSAQPLQNLTEYSTIARAAARSVQASVGDPPAKSCSQLRGVTCGERPARGRAWSLNFERPHSNLPFDLRARARMSTELDESGAQKS